MLLKYLISVHLPSLYLLFITFVWGFSSIGGLHLWYYLNRKDRNIFKPCFVKVFSKEAAPLAFTYAVGILSTILISIWI